MSFYKVQFGIHIDTPDVHIHVYSVPLALKLYIEQTQKPRITTAPSQLLINSISYHTSYRIINQGYLRDQLVTQVRVFITIGRIILTCRRFPDP